LDRVKENSTNLRYRFVDIISSHYRYWT